MAIGRGSTTSPTKPMEDHDLCPAVSKEHKVVVSMHGPKLQPASPLRRFGQIHMSGLEHLALPSRDEGAGK